MSSILRKKFNKSLGMAILPYLIFIGIAQGQTVNSNWIVGNNQFRFVNDSLVIDSVFTADINDFCFNQKAAISNDRGEMEIYSDGMNLFDKSYRVTSNGSQLRSRAFGKNTMIAIPSLFRADEHYFIYLPDYPTFQGMMYSAIDMNLNDGMGDVDNDKKNIQIFGQYTYSYIDLMPGSCTDLVIVAKERFTSNLHFIVIDSEGFSEPIIVNCNRLSIEDNPMAGGIAVDDDYRSIVIDNGKGTKVLLEFSDQYELLDQIILPVESTTTITYAGVFDEFGNYYDKEHYLNDINQSAYTYYQYSSSTVLQKKELFSITSGAFNSLTRVGSSLYFIHSSTSEFIGLIDVTDPAEPIIDINYLPFSSDRGCTTNSLPLIVRGRPRVDLSYQISTDKIICREPIDISIDFVMSADALVWSTGDTISATTIDLPGIYTIEATIDGCIIRDSIEVLLGDDCEEPPITSSDCHIYLPNAISLTSDQGNDIFRPISNCVMEEYSLAVYDRWGGRIFSSSSPEISWSASRIGSGVYSYRVLYRYVGDQQMTYYSGTVSVFK